MKVLTLLERVFGDTLGGMVVCGGRFGPGYVEVAHFNGRKAGRKALK